MIKEVSVPVKSVPLVPLLNKVAVAVPPSPLTLPI